MNIRRATAEDCPAMLKLIKELAVFEKAPNEVTVDPVHFEYSGFGPNPVWWAFVAEQVEGIEELDRAEENLPDSDLLNLSKSYSNSLIAFALYYIRYSTWKGQVMYLEDIIVTEKMRGKGIGTKLMETLIVEARKKGFKRISWQVLDWNEPALAFYRKYRATFDAEWVNVSIEV